MGGTQDLASIKGAQKTMGGPGGSNMSKVLKTGMIEKKPMTEMKGVRDDIEEEDEEESYYR